MNRLNVNSTDALHWAEQFIKTVTEQGKSCGDIDADWLCGWFANYWGAVRGPLALRITELERQLSEAKQNTAFFRCCALSGEVPDKGDEPFPRLANRHLTGESDE
jgi:hypothetical protein